MKLMKTMKKLKFWSKSKRKKKDLYYQKLPHTYEYDWHPCYYHPLPSQVPPAPPPDNCQCHLFQAGVAEPSAPPLPPWLDLEEHVSDQCMSVASVVRTSNASINDDHCISVGASQETHVRNSNASTKDEDDDDDGDRGTNCKPVESYLRQHSSTEISTTGSDSQLQEISSIRTTGTANNTMTTTTGSMGSTSTSKQGDIITTSSSSFELQAQAQAIVVRTANTSTDTANNSSKALQQFLPTENAAAGGVRLFGCVVDVGGLLLRCFFPCFHISEPPSCRVSDKALANHNHNHNHIM